MDKRYNSSNVNIIGARIMDLTGALKTKFIKTTPYYLSFVLRTNGIKFPTCLMHAREINPVSQ